MNLKIGNKNCSNQFPNVAQIGLNQFELTENCQTFNQMYRVYFFTGPPRKILSMELVPSNSGKITKFAKAGEKPYRKSDGPSQSLPHLKNVF